LGVVPELKPEEIPRVRRLRFLWFDNHTLPFNPFRVLELARWKPYLRLRAGVCLAEHVAGRWSCIGVRPPTPLRGLKALAIRCVGSRPPKYIPVHIWAKKVDGWEKVAEFYADVSWSPKLFTPDIQGPVEFVGVYSTGETGTWFALNGLAALGW